MDSHDIIVAARNQAINTYPERDAKESLRASIDTAYRLAEAQLPAAPDYENLVNDVTEKVLRSYPYMTSQEFALVIEAGVAGELTRQTKPTAAAIFGWLAAYMSSDLRKEAIRNYRRSTPSSDARELSRAEIDALNRAAEVRGLRALWAEFKQYGRILDDHLQGYVAMVMDAAIDRNLFDIRPEDWKVAQEDASHIRRERGGWLDRALPTEKSYITKWVMLEMCFGGQLATGRDLVIDA